MKPGTYTQIYIQLVFSPKRNDSLITKNFENKLYGYMGEMINNAGHKTIIINGMPDHVHLFLGLNPKIAISDLVRDLKKSTTNFINSNGFQKGRFLWQEGYGGFS